MTRLINFHTDTILTFTGGNNAVGGNTSVTIAAPSNGTVSFNWVFSGEVISVETGPQYDPLSYIVDGNLFQLTDNSGSQTQDGFATLSVTMGQIFGFNISTVDGAQGAAQVSVTNFSFTPSEVDVPFGVDSSLGLGLLGAAAALKFRRRRKA